jgi:hypothetical protein
MSSESIGVARSARGSYEVGPLPLHERLSKDLDGKFRDLAEYKTSEFTPDLVIRIDQRVAVIEIKTGDPTLPLPSSANAQMLILKDAAVTSLGAVEVVPVLVTNYRIDDADREELENTGIKLIEIDGPKYDSNTLFSKIEEVVGAGAAKSPRENSGLVTA